MAERCYNCGKEEKITKGVSDIEKIEVDLEDYSDEEERFMPLCSECVKKWKIRRYMCKSKCRTKRIIRIKGMGL